MVIVGAGPGRAGGRRVRRVARGWTCWCWRATPRAARPAPARASRTTSAFPPASRARRWPGGRCPRRRSSGPRWPSAAPPSGWTATAAPTASTCPTGQVVRTRTIVIATGVRYRKLDLPALPRFEGAGVYYSATHLEGQLCAGQQVAIVGGGNSAGQAAVYLSGLARHVHILVRGPGLAESMSRYLIQRIESTPNVTLRTRRMVETLEGEAGLERVGWRHVETGERETQPIPSLFLMTGADPNTAWLEGCVRMDDRKFVKTGADLLPEELAGGCLAAGPAALPAGDQHPGRVLRRGRPRHQRQAGGLGGGRRINLRAAGSPGAARAVAVTGSAASLTRGRTRPVDEAPAPASRPAPANGRWGAWWRGSAWWRGGSSSRRSSRRGRTHAQAQVHPAVAHLQALLAALAVRLHAAIDRRQVRASVLSRF